AGVEAKVPSPMELMMETYKRGLAEATGWLVFLSLLMVLALAVPKTVFDADSKDFILLIGAVGIWRYSMG
ncbi:hypothetical protein Q2410_26630, partial [Escherichia coli]|nr:hypothetical protein [Escherichia coli]